MRGKLPAPARRPAAGRRPDRPKSTRERPADDRLDAGRGHLVGEFERTEHVVGVGERQRRLAVGLGEFGEPRDRQRASSSEYDEWTCRWTKPGLGRPSAGTAPSFADKPGLGAPLAFPRIRSA